MLRGAMLPPEPAPFKENCEPDFEVEAVSESERDLVVELQPIVVTDRNTMAAERLRTMIVIS
jgi:hypothetical protein